MPHEKEIFLPSGADRENSIKGAIKLAAEFAKETKDDKATIKFKFSSITLRVTKDSDPEEVDRLWRKMDREQDEAQAPQRQAEREKAQRRMAEVMQDFQASLAAGPEAVVAWYRSYNNAITTAVPNHAADVKAGLEAAGYKRNELGDDGKTTAENIAAMPSKKDAARYVIGQLLVNMNGKEPPYGRFANHLLNDYDSAVTSGAKTSAAPKRSI